MIKAKKTCENGHENAYLNTFCNKCGTQFKAAIKPEFVLVSPEITMKKYILTENISKTFLINDTTLIYQSDNKYFLFRFTDYKKEKLIDHPMWNYGSEIAEHDSFSALYIIQNDGITALSKRFFDNNQICDNVDSVSKHYVNTFADLPSEESTIVTLNSGCYVINGNDVLNLDTQEGFKFDFPLHSVAFEGSALIGQHGAKLELFINSSSVSKKYTHSLSIEKVIMSADDVIFLDTKGDVYVADKRDISNSVNRLPKLNNIHSILVNDSQLLAISYEEMTILDLNTTEVIKRIPGTFEQNKVWLLGDNILTLEKTPNINSYSVCLYKFKYCEGSSRIINRHEFDDVLIKEVLYVKETLSKLIMHFKGSDGVKYLAMVEV